MATFGKTTNGTSSSPSSTDKVAVSQATPATAGTVSTGTARLSLSASGSTSVKFVIYSNSGGEPGNRLAESGVVTLNSTTVAALTFTFSGANQISVSAGTPYWIGVAWADPGSPSVNIFRDTTSAMRREQSGSGFTWPTLPNPFGTGSSLSGPIDAYVTTTSTSAPTVSAGADVTGQTVNTAFSRTATENNNGSTITSRSWTIQAGPTGVGSTIGTAAALSWTPTVTGTYTLRYSATNAIGTGTDDMSISVAAPGAPTVGAGADVASQDVDTAFTRTATETGSGITAREWKIVSGPLGVGTVLSVAAALTWTPTLEGVYILRYSATNSGGTGTDDVSITVVLPYATPGEILHIGVGSGLNHFSVDIARSSSNRELMECEQIEAGLDEDPFFHGVEGYAKCGFWTSVAALPTSGSSYPRCELREVEPGGSVNMAWDPHDGGTHWIRARSAATHLMAVKPTLILAQQHSGEDDVIQVRTQLRSGVVNLEAVLNGATGTPVTLSTSYTVGTEYDWMLEILPPLNGQTALGRIYYQSWIEPVHTWPVTDMPTTSPGHFYKAGNYMNSNTSTENGNSSEFGSSTLRNLQHWHTGWATPDNGFWGLPDVDAGTDVSTPSGWAVSLTGDDGALEADRVWYVVDGPSGNADVGTYVSNNATLSWAPTTQGVYRLRYGVTTDIGTNFDDLLITVTAPVAGSASGGFLLYANA